MYSASSTWTFLQVGSPIRVSPDIAPACGSPGLIAANHALLRPLTPRHPPYALSSLTCVTRQNLDSTFSVVKVQLLWLSFATSQGLQPFEASGLRQTFDTQNDLGHRPRPPDHLGYMSLTTLSWHSTCHIYPFTDESILYLVLFVKWAVSLISKSALSRAGFYTWPFRLNVASGFGPGIVALRYYKHRGIIA